MRIGYIAANTFREAVRDRVLYNLIVFAFLMIGASLVLGQITIGVERELLVNLGLAAIAFFGVLIAIFIGIGLVSKEIDKRTVYTVLTRPVQRWQFILGKYFGLVGTLAVNTFFMGCGLFLALLYMTHKFERADIYVLIAIFFVFLQMVIVTSFTMLFSSFSTPIESAVMAFCFFVIGSFSTDLHSLSASAKGIVKVFATIAAYVVPNISALNVSTAVAHGEAVAGATVALNLGYALLYSGAMVAAAALIFQRRNMK
ncbi:MAG TPA: ABC transporter permease [Terriglobales bacterium]|nr:ABC transporter permease [Terriglobales bacterium]